MTRSRRLVKRARFALAATCVLAAFGALHDSSAAAATGDNLPAITAATLGFNGRYKLGCWAPIAVTIRGTTTTVHGALSVEVPDGDGVRVHYISDTIDIPAGEERDVLWYVKLGRQVDTLTIALHQSSDEATPPATLRELPLDRALPVETRLVLNLGPAIAPPDSLKPLGLELVELDASDQLPGRWIGYDAVEALVLTTSHPDLITHLTDDTGQLLAVEDWLAAGGRVVICDGSDSRQVLQPDSPLGRLVPGTLGEPVALPRFEALETYSGSAQRIPSAIQKTDSLKVSRLRDVQGVVEAAEGDVPMVVRAPHALGELTYVAVALDQPPIAEWAGRTALA
ncbi:MAG TPA: hypothetical protein VHV77_15500, partial [Pirellulales bacterium]|nr:hypothetical protein [Pirellulales bacterium]